MRSAHAHFRTLAVAATVVACSATALANPTGPAVVSGAASIGTTGNVLQITNTPGTIINWQTFSIDAGELTRFIQQSPASAVLNRVVTQHPSAILGALESNGRVFLVNPNGILFGAGSRVDVAGLLASTLALSDSDFIAGRLRFTGPGGVLFQGGQITTPPGGQVYLVGGQVVNTGLIGAPNGEIVLAAGESVELVDPGTPNLRVEVSAAQHQAVNIGSIVANAGRIGIFAGLIDHAGIVSADTAVATEDGRIVLRATRDIGIAPGSTLNATGPGTGSIQIQSVTGNVALEGANLLVDPLRGTLAVSGLSQTGIAPFATTGLTFGATNFGLVGAGPSFGFTTGTSQEENVGFESTVPTLITGVPTLMTGVPTLIRGVPTLTSSVPTLTTGVPTLTSTVPTLITGVPTLTSSVSAPFAPILPLGSFPVAPSSIVSFPEPSPLEALPPPR